MNSYRTPISLSRLARLNQSDRLGLVLLISITLHLLAVFGVAFKAPEIKKSGVATSLEVVLVNSKSSSRPVKADALAQANLDGGGNTDAERQAKSPLPVLDQPQHESEAVQKKQQVSQLEQQAKLLMTQVKATQHVEPVSAKIKPSEAPTEKSGSDLAMRSLEAARLEAQISRDWDAYQKKPKRNFVSARTQEYRFARYAEDWRAKVEKVGNLNYPEEAKRQKIYGSLQLIVNIKADGSVERVEIKRSSGHKELDEAAIRIVNLAAPYAAFPEDIRRDTDILGIVRTWTFTRADQLDTAGE
ncbi:MAG: energy transducer TonB [Hydrogenophilales bacterium CG_4_9_14_3_um_filter_59_35]|nr:MAG: energy transducer TonB [Hydrogenophilales bacterium CG18_big_fil_WC_8_21_14_2_50_58_12]PIY00419.1 MAG: energy transducer TonB [Hydrogenophilales bacterium CG_4_10_14_3_um_filter_58_23]PJB06082.1 MAG: energy transducer TonB [Hydrogenophilales bacterium CG_4_9_14_3_um_filter_59_35]